jgi:OmpA family protein
MLSHNGPTIMVLLVTFLISLTAGTVLAQQLYIYPQRGQSPQQQQQDQAECNGWAMQQSGYNPGMAAGAPPPPPPPGGGAVRGGAKGAAVGAIGGAIGGNAGKGAAIGAATGAVFGGMRRNAENRAYQSEVAAQQSQVAAQQENFRRALTACLSGRGYTVQ